MTDNEQQLSAESMQPALAQHMSVMTKEVIEIINPHVNGIYVDATLGLGGHSLALLHKNARLGKVIGIDKDKSSLKVAAENLREYANQCEFVHEHYCHIDRVLSKQRIKRVDGIILDLGISSYQLDNQQRGFSFQKDGPLDMRMNQDSKITAFDLVNSLSEIEISKILRDYGEERFHSRIARSIVKQRSLAPLRTTKDLREIVIKSLPLKYGKERIHPATRTFQAFRIAVNRELEEIELVLDKCVECLNPGGRVVVIAFHSLEDRIVKQKFRLFERLELLKILTKKPLRPSDSECEQNSRARSARLRGAERK